MKIADPAEFGFDPVRLARIDIFLKTQYLDTGRLKNAQTVVAREGTPVHYSHAGLYAKTERLCARMRCSASPA